MNDIFASTEAANGLRIAFDREDRHGHKNNHTFYLRYEGPLPAPNDVKVDITIKEILCYQIQDRPIQLRIFGAAGHNEFCPQRSRNSLQLGPRQTCGGPSAHCCIAPSKPTSRPGWR